MLMLPLELPGPPVSCVAFQSLNVWISLTLAASEAIDGPLFVAELEPPLTVIAMSVSQETPLPHAFTCNVCAPDPAVTSALTDLPSTTVVSELLSSE